ncbi:MAG TPA: hypothetical protein VJS44_21860 [Pyrinomonadaceae bacterium]|nr:hypothetical protein [Pyrinomonadaceae bacterium]
MSKTISAPAFRNRIVTLLAFLLLTATGALAQSTSVDQPTPVTSNRVSGEITARDIGDSRLTRHFYVLTGTPGDLVVTVESRNLNGDIDLFQSGTLRPLAKVSIYAGELSTSTSKSIYLRQRETIILRVEARTPNDDRGEYRITFSGGFEAMAAPAETDTATEQPAVAARRNSGTRRVSSVGARIDEPVETAKTATPETATERPADSGSAAENRSSDNAATETSPQPVTTARAQRPPTSRSTTGRRRRGRATPSRPPETATQNSPEPVTAGEPPPVVAARPTGIEAGAKLVIETRDGMRVERFMNTVRRVTVENGQIVVVMRDGKVTRHPMASVTRMAIEP